MAALTTAQVVRIWDDGTADRVVVYALRNVTSGDTFDAAADLSVVERAVVLGTTVSVAIATSQTGTVITMPTGLTADAAWMLAWGSRA